MEDPLDTSFDIEPLIHGSMKDKIPELELAIDVFITPEEVAKLNHFWYSVLLLLLKVKSI